MARTVITRQAAAKLYATSRMLDRIHPDARRLLGSKGRESRPDAAFASFDDLVGAGEDRLRHGQAERLGGLQIDDQLEGGRLLDRQIGGLGALENLSGINAELAIYIGEARPIADQAAGHDGLTPCIDRRDRIARRQRQELVAMRIKERAG